MFRTILKIVLWWQGLYYGLTGLWALVALDHFSKVTGHYGDAFEMHSIAALALILGAAFIWGALRERHLAFASWLSLGAALAVIIPELVYFDEIKGTLFLLDLFEEIAVAVALAIGLRGRRDNDAL